MCERGHSATSRRSDETASTRAEESHADRRRLREPEVAFLGDVRHPQEHVAVGAAVAAAQLLRLLELQPHDLFQVRGALRRRCSGARLGWPEEAACAVREQRDRYC